MDLAKKLKADNSSSSLTDSLPPSPTPSNHDGQEKGSGGSEELEKGSEELEKGSEVQEVKPVDKTDILNDLDRKQKALTSLTTKVVKKLTDHSRSLSPNKSLDLIATKDVYHVLVVGSGGREHAICQALSRSKFNVQIYNAGSLANPGILPLCTGMRTLKSVDKIVAYAIEIKADLVIVGSEEYLNDKIANLLQEAGIDCFGPTYELSQIETNKAFLRDLMAKYGMASYNPTYLYLTKFEESFLEESIRIDLKDNFVVKANGLRRGKGVKVLGNDFHNVKEGIAYCQQLIDQDGICLLEEKLVGKEFSLMSFTDGSSHQAMPPVRDYKRLLSGNSGCQTGGMGSVTLENHSLPDLTPNDIEVARDINRRVISAIQKEYPEHLYTGVLYGSYMKTRDGLIKVIEFNVRFGDPEAINIMALLATDFMEICLRCVKSSLRHFEIKYKNQASLVTYVVPKGYPHTNFIDHQIYTYDVPNPELIYYASVNCPKDKMELKGSRAVACVGVGANLDEARQKSLEQAAKIYGPVEYRTDIGKEICDELTLTSKFSYKDAGVDIDTNDKIIAMIRDDVLATHSKNVVSRHGDFAGLYQVKTGIVSASIDGCGTKSLLVEKYHGVKGHQIIGESTVNHGINDCIVSGTKPLFFLDYFGSHKVDPEAVKNAIIGIRTACQPANCSLLGGETAEMPSIYREGCSELVGVMVGYVFSKKNLIDPTKIKVGDVVYAFDSVGPHTNGYSLIRKIIENTPIMDNLNPGDKKGFIDFLTSVHRSYYQEVTIFQEILKIKGLVHITGGGLIENPPRVLPPNVSMLIPKANLKLDPYFSLIQNYGKLSDSEMYRTFNCGVGMMMIINKSDEHKVKAVRSIKNWSHIRRLGNIVERRDGYQPVQFIQ